MQGSFQFPISCCSQFPMSCCSQFPISFCSQFSISCRLQFPMSCCLQFPMSCCSQLFFACKQFLDSFMKKVYHYNRNEYPARCCTCFRDQRDSASQYPGQKRSRIFVLHLFSRSTGFHQVSCFTAWIDTEIISTTVTVQYSPKHLLLRAYKEVLHT